MDAWKIIQTIDIAKPPERIDAPFALMFPGDSKAHKWGVTILNNDEAEDLSNGTVSAYFLRPDGQTVTVTGTAVANTAFVSIPSQVYAYTGIVKAGLR